MFSHLFFQSNNYQYEGNTNYGIVLDSFHESQSFDESVGKSSYTQPVDHLKISYIKSNSTHSAHPGNNGRDTMSGLGGHYNEGYNS